MKKSFEMNSKTRQKDFCPVEAQKKICLQFENILTQGWLDCFQLINLAILSQFGVLSQVDVSNFKVARGNLKFWLG